MAQRRASSFWQDNGKIAHMLLSGYVKDRFLRDIGTMVKRAFPSTRMRRLRQADWSRRLVAENMLSVNDLIWPIFIIEGENNKEPVASLSLIHI